MADNLPAVFHFQTTNIVTQRIQPGAKTGQVLMTTYAGGILQPDRETRQQRAC